jgi:hypothetical protein
MAPSETATPATAICGEPALNFEQLGGELDPTNTTGRLQVARLIRRFAISAATADTLAPLVFGEAGR